MADPREVRPAVSTRPRHGSLRRADGEVVPLVFHPTEDPMEFVGVHASDGKPPVIRSGDQVWIDVLGAGQSVTVGELPDGPAPRTLAGSDAAVEQPGFASTPSWTGP